MHKLKQILKNILIVFTLWLLVHSAFVIIDGLKDDGQKADVAVILGSKVNEDGTLSKRLEKRLECGLNLFNGGRVKRIIVSGGLGKEGYYEGDKMKEFLLKNNIPDSVIFVDNRGDNTLATVENTIELSKTLKFNSVLVVSQYFHLTRTKMLFKKLGFKKVSGVSPFYFEFRDIYSLFREFFAYYSEQLN